MAQQPYSEKQWVYPIAQDYGLGDDVNGGNNIPMFMIRMMLNIRSSAPGDDYAKYKYAFRRAADHYYRKGLINVMNGTLEQAGEYGRVEHESWRGRTVGGTSVIDAPQKQRDFRGWVITATKIKNSQQG